MPPSSAPFRSPLQFYAEIRRLENVSLCTRRPWTGIQDNGEVMTRWPRDIHSTIGSVSAEDSDIPIRHAFPVNQHNAAKLVPFESGDPRSQVFELPSRKEPPNSPLIHFLSPSLKPRFILVLSASPRTSSLQNPL